MKENDVQKNPSDPSDVEKSSVLNTPVTRRLFLARMGALGLSATGLPTLLSACGADSPATQVPAQPDAATATPESPQPEVGFGELDIAFPDGPSSLDPAFGINSAEYCLTAWLYDNLVFLESDLTLTPGLAVEWTSSEDASVWTFKLREGVKFVHGKDFKAEDVVYSLERILDPDMGSPGLNAVGPVASVEATNDYEVVIQLSSPYADFPIELTKRWGRIVPSDKSADDLKTQAFGTGPFKLETYRPGSHTRCVRNPDFWEEGWPKLDAVTLREFPEPVAQVSALQNGEVQIIYELSPESFDQVSALDNVVVQEVATGQWFPMIMRNDTPPFDDNRVREAVKYCIDREQMVNLVLDGHGAPGNDHPVPPSHPFYLDVPVREQDYDKAKALLAEAGYPDGFTFELQAATERPIRAAQAVAIQQMCEPAGIKFEVKTIDYDTFIAQVYKKGGAYIGVWGMRPTLDGQLYPFFTAEGSWNEYAYNNPELDEVLNNARAALDIEERKRLYQEAQRILTNEGPALVTLFANYIAAAQSSVKGFQVHPMSWLDVRHVYFES